MKKENRTILVIEDNALNREILSDILSDMYNVLCAENGKEGMEMLASRTATIDLVLLDIHMPVMNGYEVLKAMHNDPDMSEIPVIVTTGDDTDSDEQRCLQLGASDFVRKPYNPVIVKLRVDSVLRLVETTRSIHQKTTFLQNLSHEIRTPMNAIYGFAQMLGLPDGTLTAEEKQEYNSYINSNYKMIEMLLSDIFEAADSDNDKYVIVKSDVHVNDVCRAAINSTTFRKQPEVAMRFTTEVADDFTIYSDERRIQQVLVNYLTNACKHTMEGEIHLHCSVTERPGKIVFSVTDTGTGIPADKAELIFKRFTKLNNFVQGTGLGLSICRLIAEKLDAEAYLDTTYNGKGSRFVFAINKGTRD